LTGEAEKERIEIKRLEISIPLSYFLPPLVEVKSWFGQIIFAFRPVPTSVGNRVGKLELVHFHGPSTPDWETTWIFSFIF